jgi:hypothetical protein
MFDDDDLNELAKEPYINQLVDDIDQVIKGYEGSLNSVDVSGVLLSRVTLLCTMHPEIGKGLVRFVWEKLDEIEQANPGNML